MAEAPSGTRAYLSKTRGIAIAVTAVSNAVEAVCTKTDHGLADNAVVEVEGGWGPMNTRVFEVDVVDDDTFKLKGFDTTDTNRFPAGEGVCKVYEITDFKELDSFSIESSGGDPKDIEYRKTYDDEDQSLNNGFGATKYTLKIDPDSSGTDGYKAMQTLTANQGPGVLKQVTKSGRRIYFPSRAALNENLVRNDNEPLHQLATFNGRKRITTYAPGA